MRPSDQGIEQVQDTLRAHYRAVEASIAVIARFYFAGLFGRHLGCQPSHIDAWQGQEKIRVCTLAKAR